MTDKNLSRYKYYKNISYQYGSDTISTINNSISELITALHRIVFERISYDPEYIEVEKDYTYAELSKAIQSFLSIIDEYTMISHLLTDDEKIKTLTIFYDLYEVFKYLKIRIKHQTYEFLLRNEDKIKLSSFLNDHNDTICKVLACDGKIPYKPTSIYSTLKQSETTNQIKNESTSKSISDEDLKKITDFNYEDIRGLSKDTRIKLLKEQNTLRRKLGLDEYKLPTESPYNPVYPSTLHTTSNSAEVEVATTILPDSTTNPVSKPSLISKKAGILGLRPKLYLCLIYQLVQNITTTYPIPSKEYETRLESVKKMFKSGKKLSVIFSEYKTKPIAIPFPVLCKSAVITLDNIQGLIDLLESYDLEKEPLNYTYFMLCYEIKWSDYDRISDESSELNSQLLYTKDLSESSINSIPIVKGYNDSSISRVYIVDRCKFGKCAQKERYKTNKTVPIRDGILNGSTKVKTNILVI